MSAQAGLATRGAMTTSATVADQLPAAARSLATECAELLVVVESQCLRQGCGPTCLVATEARRLAVSAAELPDAYARARRSHPGSAREPGVAATAGLPTGYPENYLSPNHRIPARSRMCVPRFAGSARGR